ncbi:GNAT family N-acetyltransferase [Aliikangiella coralliicola]|uniref:GNAT family N-acetyltransferase n=1 Tax=Aliikangiella coralliicola TaxID=2592383 RepID=A0A545TWD8_9GAMM|nr:GNAT family N-acetyltransferase [Aliikangiella coralliicola]TQV81537.1 GNAT family N-acetyltransferase [Aliikangiella coralliicola]
MELNEVGPGHSEGNDFNTETNTKTKTEIKAEIKEKVSLTDVTVDNFDDVVDLEVLEDQKDYVADNTYSLAESKYYPSYQPRAITYENKVVGFLMYESMESENKPNEYDIFRLMIDHRYQGKGIGRQAMKLLLDEINRNENVERITICYEPKNPVAKGFYASFGFKEIGIDDDGEMIAEINYGG